MDIAIVTGAGSGMGKDFAKLLDNANLDEIWAVALHDDGLIDLKTQVKTPVRALAMDLTKPKSIENIEELLSSEKPNVKWLANFAGFGKFGGWQDIKPQTSQNMIDLNCKAMVALTDICVPYMQKGARIVDMASVAAFQPVPYINIYAATKAFVLSYARSLSYELKGRGISVTCACPYWTKTNFFDRAVDEDNKIIKKYVVMYNSDKVVKKIYKYSLKRKKLCIYGFISNLQVFLTKILPASVVCKVWLKQQKLTKN